MATGAPSAQRTPRCKSSPSTTSTIETPASLKRELLGGDGYEDVTYSPSGETWFVLSGFRGDNIFYEKYLFNDDVVSVFGIEFPTDEKPYYAPMIERIEDSFEPGRSD